MNIAQVIAQIRSQAPIFGGRVAGAASYAIAITEQSWLDAPAAYVIAGGSNAEDQTDFGGFRQNVRRFVDVIVVLDNSINLADRRGQSNAEQLHVYEAAINKAILGWRPDFDPSNPDANIETRGFQLDSAGFADDKIDRAQFRWRFTYALDTVLSTVDAWQPTTTPFTSIPIEAITGQDTIAAGVILAVGAP